MDTDSQKRTYRIIFKKEDGTMDLYKETLIANPDKLLDPVEGMLIRLREDNDDLDEIMYVETYPYGEPGPHLEHEQMKLFT